MIKSLCDQSKDVFLRSSVEPHICSSVITPSAPHACPNFPKATGDGFFESPVMSDGEVVSAEYIGW